VFDLGRNVSYAFRLLTRSSAYSLTVIAVLALGIACNVIAFSLFKAVRVAPLAGVADSGDFYYVGATSRGGQLSPLTYPDYRYLRGRAYPDLAFWAAQPMILGRGADGRRAFGEFVSGNYFSTLGVSAQLGRTLLPSDEIAAGQHPVAVIADGLWRRAFGADPGIVGRTIHLNSQPLTVVGVAHADFRGAIVGIASDVFVPVMMHPQLTGENWLENDDRNVQAFTRLRRGVTLDQASAEAAILSAELADARPIDDIEQRAVLVPIWRWPFGAQTYAWPAVMVMGAMAALLLIAVCANVTGLVLVRSIDRRREVAARFALGASRGRILRQLTAESLVLAVPGAIAGFYLPRLAESFIGGAASQVSLPLSFNVEPDALLAGFTMLLACVSALVYALPPAIRLSHIDLAAILQDERSLRASGGSRLRASLVVAQIAVSLMLLVGTGLALRTLAAAQRTDVGFDANGVSWATLDMRAGGHDERSGRLAYQQLLDTVRTDPRVESASLSAYLPLTLIDWRNWAFEPEGYRRQRDEDLVFAVNIVGPDYFRTLHIPLAAGREFEVLDDETSGRVAIVNETFARRFWGDADTAIGRRVRTGDDWLTVIGVSHDVKYARLDETSRPYVYVPFTQVYVPDMTVQVRSSADAPSILATIRRSADRVDARLPVLASGVLADQLRASAATLETVARVLGMIGILAAALAGLGVYGVVAYTVRAGAYEIGIRTAVGATRWDVARRFLISGAALGGAGVLVGLSAAAVFSLSMRASLYGVTTLDAVSFGGAAAALLAVALAASFLPAWRAATIHPVDALRHR
jgi:predicted permease